MSEISQGLMITLIGMLTIFGVLSLLVFASEVLKRLLSMGEQNTQRQIANLNKSQETSFKIIVDDREYSVDIKQNAVVVDGKYHTVSLKPKKSEPSEPALRISPPSTEASIVRPSIQQYILAPIGGKIKQIQTRVGNKIQTGDVILTIEVMKMEIEVRADKTGRVEKILVEVGQTVTLNEPLIVITS
ncbi:MAG: OadG family transporter subunit [Candidatus Bathyarchaeia archaeon]